MNDLIRRVCVCFFSVFFGLICSWMKVRMLGGD